MSNPQDAISPPEIETCQWCHKKALPVELHDFAPGSGGRLVKVAVRNHPLLVWWVCAACRLAFDMGRAAGIVETEERLKLEVVE